MDEQGCGCESGLCCRSWVRDHGYGIRVVRCSYAEGNQPSERTHWKGGGSGNCRGCWMLYYVREIQSYWSAECSADVQTAEGDLRMFAAVRGSNLEQVVRGCDFEGFGVGCVYGGD